MANETSLNTNVSMGNYGTSGGSIESNWHYDYIKAGYGTKLATKMESYMSPLLSANSGSNIVSRVFNAYRSIQKQQLSSFDGQSIDNSGNYPYDNFDRSDITDPKDGYQASKMLGAGLSMAEDNAYRSVFSDMGIDY